MPADGGYNEFKINQLLNPRILVEYEQEGAFQLTHPPPLHHPVWCIIHFLCWMHILVWVSFRGPKIYAELVMGFGVSDPRKRHGPL